MNIEQALVMFRGEELEPVRDSLRKLHANLMFRGRRVIVGVSGGSDSDVLVDLIELLEPRKNYPNSEIHYCWFNTGMEYGATKSHLDDLEQKYGITIERLKAKTPVPMGCRTYGLPFLSKQVSQYISRLQSHNFGFEDEPFNVLYARYPDCKAALRFWCNEWPEGSRVNISNFRLLKEFMIENPPDFLISDRCCAGAKKDVAHDYIKQIKADLNIVGVRKSEGGARATACTSCFSEPSRKGDAAQFRLIFFWDDATKARYCEMTGITHSDLYEKYGFVRTGCACCPFGSRFESELATAEWIDPKLAAAAQNIFGKSYEYTRAYRRFKAEQDAAAKRDPDQYRLF